jgi:hypothetical protein
MAMAEKLATVKHRRNPKDRAGRSGDVGGKHRTHDHRHYTGGKGFTKWSIPRREEQRPAEQTSAREPAVRLLRVYSRASPFPMEAPTKQAPSPEPSFRSPIAESGAQRFAWVASPRLPRDPPEFDGIRDSSLPEKLSGPRP